MEVRHWSINFRHFLHHFSHRHFHHNCRFYTNFLSNSNPTLVPSLMTSYNVSKTLISLMPKRFISVISSSRPRALFFPVYKSLPFNPCYGCPALESIVRFFLVLVYANLHDSIPTFFFKSSRAASNLEKRVCKTMLFAECFLLALFKPIPTCLTCHYASMAFNDIFSTKAATWCNFHFI